MNNLKELDVKVGTERVRVKLWDDMDIQNPENPAEIVQKMIDAPKLNWYLGSAKADMEAEVDRLTTEFKTWLEEEKFLHDTEKSEVGRERMVIIKKGEEYERRKSELRAAQLIFRKIDIARKALDHHIQLLQSVGAMLRMERKQAGSDDSDIKKTTI